MTEAVSIARVASRLAIREGRQNGAADAIYRLTEEGMSLIPVFEAMRVWSATRMVVQFRV